MRNLKKKVVVMRVIWRVMVGTMPMDKALQIYRKTLVVQQDNVPQFKLD